MSPATNGPRPDLDTLSYFEDELRQTQSASKVVSLANRLASKAYKNLEACLNKDFATTKAADRARTDADEKYLAMARRQCEDLKLKIISFYASKNTAESNQTGLTYHGQEISPTAFLFCLGAVESTDMFMDICPAKLLDPSSWAASATDGLVDKYDLDLDDKVDRQYMLAAIAQEYTRDQYGNFSSRIT